MINNIYELIKDDVLMTMTEKGLVNFKAGKECRVHSVENDVVTAYWLDDIWKPIIISKDEFDEYFARK